MLHPFNMGKEYFTITTLSGEVRRVSKKRYRLLHCKTWERFAGETVRMMSLSEHEMPGVHFNHRMTVVALDRLIRDGFREIGDSMTPGTMGVDFQYLVPLAGCL